MVPNEKLAQVSGMNSFSGNLISIMSPVLAASLFALGGLKILLFIDLASFAVAFLVLLLVIQIPEDVSQKAEKKSMFAGCAEGFRYLRENKGIFTIIVTMALLNFFSRLTYENILSPMILARSGNNSIALGIVNAVMGIGGIVGGVIAAIGKFSKNNVKMIYLSATLSFLLGDVMMGGFLADYVFEPFMMTENTFASALHLLVGRGAGSGMAVMFLCTGLLGSLFSLLSYRQKEIQMKRCSLFFMKEGTLQNR